jgi:hypothetical protein
MFLSLQMGRRQGTNFNLLTITITMQDQNYRWRLVAKKLAGEASEEESTQLQAILDDDPYLNVLMMDLSNLWSATNEVALSTKPVKVGDIQSCK